MTLFRDEPCYHATSVPSLHSVKDFFKKWAALTRQATVVRKSVCARARAEITHNFDIVEGVGWGGAGGIESGWLDPTSVMYISIYSSLINIQTCKLTQ